MRQIHYRSGYKYQLTREFHVKLPPPFRPTEWVRTEYLWVSPSGVLTIHKGYTWDGPSGPLLDHPRRMKAALVHDALYQLLRHEHFPPAHRDQADRIFAEILVADGTHRFWASLYRRGLQLFGSRAADPKSIHKELTAP